METKFDSFDDNFLEDKAEAKEDIKNKYMKGLTNTKQYLINVDKIEEREFEGVCVNQFYDYNKYRNEMESENSLSKRNLYEDAKKSLLNCLDLNGKLFTK